MNSAGTTAAAAGTARDLLIRAVFKGRRTPTTAAVAAARQHTAASHAHSTTSHITASTSVPKAGSNAHHATASTTSRRSFVPSDASATAGIDRTRRLPVTPAISAAVVAGGTIAGICASWEYGSVDMGKEEIAEYGGGGGGLTGGWGMLVGARRGGGPVCLCKSKVSGPPEDSLQDYARRLNRLRSLRDIFEEYATVTAEGVGKRMTCGDFLRAMLCYRYVGVESRELKRRCARYVNPLLGDAHGLISFDEFCFLMSLVSIPASLFDVAFAAADSDGSGTIDGKELDTLVNRLASPLDVDGSPESGSGSGGRKPNLSGQHKRLTAAWFGEDGKGSVPREEFAAFVRHLRLDIKTVECRLYSRYVTPDDDSAEKNPQASKPRSWFPRFWWPINRQRRHVKDNKRAASDGFGSTPRGKETAGSGGEGWWSRYESESISLADLALTLVSTCHPEHLPVHLARVNAIKKTRTLVPLRDALLLHEVLEDHAQDLEDALALYCKASVRSAVGMEDFARAAKIVSGQDLSAECVWVVFKMFDSGGDGVLQYEELMSATRDRLRRLPGQRESLPLMTHFIECVRGK